MTELPVEIRRVIINRQIESWKQSQFDLIIALRVAQKISDPQQRIDQFKGELERCEKAIVILEEELRTC